MPLYQFQITTAADAGAHVEGDSFDLGYRPANLSLNFDSAGNVEGVIMDAWIAPRVIIKGTRTFTPGMFFETVAEVPVASAGPTYPRCGVHEKRQIRGGGTRLSGGSCKMAQQWLVALRTE